MMDYALTVTLVFVAGYAAAWLQAGLWRLLTVVSEPWSVDSGQRRRTDHRPLTTDHWLKD